MCSKKEGLTLEFGPADKVYLVNRTKADAQLKQGVAITGWGKVTMHTAGKRREEVGPRRTIPRTLQCQWQGQASCLWKGARWPVVKLVHHLRNLDHNDQSLERPYLSVKGYQPITSETTALQKTDAPPMLWAYVPAELPTDEKQKAKLKASNCASLVPPEASNFN
jgi:hypothetical protein